MKLTQFGFSILCVLSLSLTLASAQENEPHNLWDAKTFNGLEMRSIGPALMAGRIADIAIHPEDDNTWYVAVGSGGVWKTENAGVTWHPLFEDQSVYSVGCVTIDPHNPNTIYVGTGENVGGRHVGFGDGIYRSLDGGKSWENLGLKRSEHISKILVHPQDANTIYVAAQGPLWSSGGDRGLYISKDFGKTWDRKLGGGMWTGVTDIAIDPRDPSVMYAATWDRHRTTAAYLGGGPGTGIYRSTNGGESWNQMKTGLPTSNMGKIGLALSPQNPDVVYAAIELDLRTGGVYRSTDRGQTWEKRSNAVAGATGPHYYQELYACPHNEGRVYLVDVRMQVSEDGGKTFRRMNEKNKHSDNHALAFRADDPDYLLVGTDGGIYESFDDHAHWRFIANMPITQFYKLAVDDAEPFYNVYGGTQDNNTQGGPSRTDNVNGIQNGDWKVVLDWDGHQPATEPGNPNIMYGQRQEGTLSRIDRSNGEVIDIQPQPGADDTYERYNWDAPILVSPHRPERIYFASQRLWRSDNRGDEWKAISGDLTRNQNRLELPIMGRKQSWNNAWDLLAMSNYNTITSIAESPVAEDHIMIGTDDGIIQYTADAGDQWNKIEINKLPGVPKTAYVNDIKADLFDANTWYVALDNHKAGDFKPYLYTTTDNGRSWKAIQNNLPEPCLVWRFVQDHEDEDLFFIGTEFGVYFSADAGAQWTPLKGKMPTIPVRDLTIQRREDDLVLATFGRSFYILDDLSPLRNISEEILESKATLFDVKDPYWYVRKPHLSFGGKKGSQGDSYYVADNPPYGAVFTTYTHEELSSPSAKRKKAEKELNKEGKDVPFPGFDVLDEEKLEEKPLWIFVIKNQSGEVIRKLTKEAKKGFQRTTWDMRYPSPNVVKTGQNKISGRGFLAPPGVYSVEAFLMMNGEQISAGTPKSFELKRINEGALEGATMAEVSDFYRKYEAVARKNSQLSAKMGNVKKRLTALQLALKQSTLNDPAVFGQLKELNKAYFSLDKKLNGSPTIKMPGEKTQPTIGERMFAVVRGLYNSTYGPTAMHREQLQIADDIISGGMDTIREIRKGVDQVENQIEESGVIVE